MYVDAITLAAVVDELGLLLKNARIDTIIQPTEHALALQCYAPGTLEQGGANRWLYLSTHPQLARVHITARKPQRVASEPPPFVMLLRKHLEGARIESIRQPRWERVVEITTGYRTDPDTDERTRFRLIIEIMGRLSNIILCDEEGIILGSIKRVGADVNRYRTIAAGVKYVPPPPQYRTFAGQSLPRLEPTTLTASQLSIAAAEDKSNEGSEHSASEKPRKGRAKALEQPKLWQLLMRQMLGMSALLAKEIVYRTTEDAETTVAQSNEDIWEELAWNARDLTTLYDTHAWQPRLLERTKQGDDSTAPSQKLLIAFAVYMLDQYALETDIHVRTSPSINVILDDYYAQAEWFDAMEGVRGPTRKVLQTQRDRCKRKAVLLEQEMQTSEEANSYRLYGDLLLAHQYDVQQGQSSAKLQNFFNTAEGAHDMFITVPLDPRFDAIGNSNRYFTKYRKLRRALTLVPDQIEQNSAELATIEQLLTDLVLAETPQEVTLVNAEVQSLGYIRGKNIVLDKRAQKAAKKAKSGNKQGKVKQAGPGGGTPLRVQSRDGFIILIGKNSRQNEEVTFRQATSNDMWLHARNIPGSHVIIKAAGRDIPRSTIEQAARIAAYYSQARGSTHVPIDYTLQKNVKHMKGGGPGMVIYERERTIEAEPDNNI
jgi:predicted ribosome quality control (RQC) complex YloA/Tae2 family protein